MDERVQANDTSEVPTLEITDPERLPSAGAADHGAVLVVLGGSSIGRVVALDGASLVVGRDLDCDVCLPEDGISRRHARLIRGDDGRWDLEDLQSTNGTQVNGERIGCRRLEDGDRVSLGSTSLKFVARADLDAGYQARLYELSVRDPLTRLYNRRFFDDRLRSEIAYARRHGGWIGLILGDIDHFKRVNDTWGHAAGDRVLAEVARVLQNRIRTEDVLARYGGEEFVLLVRQTPPEGLEILAERLRSAVEAAEIPDQERRLRVTLSLGAHDRLGDPHLTAEALLEEADRLLYEAKAAGRNRVRLSRRPEPADSGEGSR